MELHQLTETNDSRASAQLRSAVESFAGKWKLEILWRLRNGPVRFNALQRSLFPITHQTLTRQLRTLEMDGLISRRIYAEVPSRVDYRITRKARALAPVFRSIFTWHRRGISPGTKWTNRSSA